MRLADFIDENTEAILSEWETFARTLLPASAHLDLAGLRDHAEQILRAAVVDLRTAQSESAQASKSRGESIRLLNSPETAAQTHGLLRATSGFTLKQLVAEYRALRASVLRLWAAKHTPGAEALDDMTRFNEAIDQAVAESVEFFARENERWRNVFLGVLGHDLRGPLNAILLTSQLLEQLSKEGPVSQVTQRIIRSGKRMRELLDDLLDYSRASLDLGIPTKPLPMELAAICQEEIDIQRIAFPANFISFDIEGSTQGLWDASRLKQVLANLIGNAAKYGDPGTPITVRLVGAAEQVVLSVENVGQVITADGMHTIFEPLRRGTHGATATERTSLGLGLFIVRQIAHAHGGEVSVSSTAGKTLFNVTLPTRPHVSP